MSDIEVPSMPDIPVGVPIPLRTDDAMVIDNFDRRLHRLEQMLTGNILGRFTFTEEGNFPEGIFIGDDPIGLIPPDAVTGVTATPGTFFENIFCDVEWVEAVTGIDSVSFDVDLAEKLAGPVYSILNVFNTGGTNIRLNALEPNKNYGVRVVPVNALGVRGTPPAWLDFTTGMDATVPSAPTAVQIVRGATSVVVKFTPPTDADVIWGHGTYRVQIDTVNTFGSVNFHELTTTAVVTAFNDIIGELPQWYARVAAIDSSGNQSAWSTIAGPSGPMGGVGDSMLLNDISAAHITVGVMDGDRINVNTLNANKIKTSSITAADITLAGGSLRAQNPVPGSSAGVLINSQGVRLYDPAGTATVILDAATGSATFSGSITASSVTGSTISGGTITGSTITGGIIRTSSSGQRVELNGTDDDVRFYNSGGTYTGRIYGTTASGYGAVFAETASLLSGFYVADNGSNGEAIFYTDDAYLNMSSGVLAMGVGVGEVIGIGSGYVALEASSLIDLDAPTVSVSANLQVGTGLHVFGGIQVNGNLNVTSGSAYGGPYGGFAFTFLDYSGNDIHFRSDGIYQNGSQVLAF